jgi:hypothetical protein
MSLKAIQARAVEALRTYSTTAEADRTDYLRQTAVAFIDAREHFFTAEGEPDWQGRTYAYRQWVRETMGLAAIPADQLPTIQSAVRYHAGNVIRSRLTPEQLTDLGLRADSPRERSVGKRERHSATLSIFSGGGRELDDAAAILSASRMIEAALRRVSLPAVGALPARDRKDVAEAVKGVYTLCLSIVDAAEAR